MELTNQGKVSPPLQLNYEDIRKSYFCLKALDHTIRQNIITLSKTWKIMLLPN